MRGKKKFGHKRKQVKQSRRERFRFATDHNLEPRLLLSVSGSEWQDTNQDGVRNADEVGLPGWTVYIDQNANGIFEEAEPSAVTDIDGAYTIDVPPGDYIVREVLQDGWRQTFPGGGQDLSDTLDSISENAADIAAQVPDRFEFTDGEFGTSIIDGGNDMFDGGNLLLTDQSGFLGVEYSQSAVREGAAFFGRGSEYFTLKSNGIFALVADGISVNSFSSTGNLGADGQGTAEAIQQSFVVNGQQYTLFAKRVFDAFDPSVNTIMIVPGDGAGINQTFAFNTDDGNHALTGLAGVDSLYYLLVAGSNGLRLSDQNFENIATRFVESLPATGEQMVTVPVDGAVEGVDFGNIPLPGTIRGVKWHEINENGERDDFEPLLEGWTIYVDVNRNGALDADEPSSVTDENGAYEILGVPLGEQFVGEVPQDGWRLASPQSETVVVFDDERFVDSSDVATAESTALQASLASLSYDVETMTGITGLDFLDSALASEVVVFPQFEQQPLLPRLDTNAKDILRGLVSSGKGLVVHASREHTAVLNDLFDFNLEAEVRSAEIVRRDTDGTRFAAGPASLDSNNATSGLIADSLPEGARNLYGESSGEIANVAWIPFGDGQIVVLGWDWFNAAPLGPADGGWPSVLDLAIKQLGTGVGGVHVVDVSNPGQVVEGVDFGNRSDPSEITGTVWSDVNQDGVFDADESLLAGATVFFDANENGIADDGEPRSTSDADGLYSLIVPAGTGTVRVLVEDGFQLNFPTSSGSFDELLDRLPAEGSGVAALVPNRFNFTEGEFGNSIGDGGNDMFDGGNMLNTNLSLAGGPFGLPIDYTNGVLVDSPDTFGEGSRYFTFKTDGLFVMGADNISIDEFSITGDLGADGSGSVSGNVLTTSDNRYKILVKRVFNSFDPSVNSVVLVPNEPDVDHSFPTDTNNGLHAITGLTDISEIYYLLFATVDSSLVQDSAIIRIADQFSELLPGDGGYRVRAEAGATAGGFDFGLQQLPGVIRGVKWHDLDGDRELDPTEPRMAGWTVFIDSNENGVLDDGELSAVTDATGAYEFVDVPLGSYVLAEVQQEGWSQTFPAGADGSGIVAVFNDPIFVDNGSTFEAESTNVQATLTDLGVAVNPFTGFSDEQFADGIGEADVLLVPELENGNLAGSLSFQAQAVIRDYVSEGGGLIVHESLGLHLQLLNNVFGFSLTAAGGFLPSQIQDETVGTAFEGGPVEIDPNSGSGGVAVNSLPADALAVYVDEVANSASVVHIPFGDGQIIVLGWDWYDAAPIGSQDSGWVEVLERSIDQLTGGSAGGLHLVDLLEPSQIIEDVNFGNFAPTGEIHGTQWYDFDADGVYDASEPGLAGWTVYIDLDNDGVAGPDDPMTVTDIAGRYSFTGVIAALDHVVRAEPRDGWVSTFPAGGGGTVVNLGPGEIRENVNFGDQAGVVLEFVTDEIGFDSPAGSTSRVTVNVVAAPQGVNGFQLNFSASDLSGLTLSNWTTESDNAFVLDGTLDTASGDTFVAGGFLRAQSLPLTLGSFDVTSVEATGEYPLTVDFAAGGFVDTQITGRTGPLPIVNFGNVTVSATETDPPTVEEVMINVNIADPSGLTDPAPTDWQTQRSQLRTMVVRFSERMRPLTAADFVLTNLGTKTDSTPEVIALTDFQISQFRNFVSISFVDGFLGDGRYQLEVLPSARDLSGNSIDGNDDGIAGDAFVHAGDEQNRLFQLSGDFDGDGVVSDLDGPTLEFWFTESTGAEVPGYLDLDGNGGLSLLDFTRFGQQLNQLVEFPAAPAAEQVLSIREAAFGDWDADEQDEDEDELSALISLL